MNTRTPSLANYPWLAALALAAAAAPAQLHGQGCVPIRGCGTPLLPSLNGFDHNNPWQVSVAYRYIDSDRYFQGSQELSDMPGMAPGQQVINTIHSFDVGVAYTFDTRLTLSLGLPVVHGERKSREEHLGMDRVDLPQYSTSATGIGDIRLTADYWLLDPEKHKHGNFALGLGFKAPSGEYDATDTFHHPGGIVEQPVDVAIQPGDGGWGIILQAQGFQRIIDRLTLYGNAMYLFNPREENGVARVPVVMGGAPMPTGPDSVNSVPDQYLGRLGLDWSILPKYGFSATLGGRIEGIPIHDAIGGDDGFRRPGYTISIEPGLSVMYRRHSFAVTAPVALERNRERSVTDKDLNRAMYPGSFADWTLFLSYSYRF